MESMDCIGEHGEHGVCGEHEEHGVHSSAWKAWSPKSECEVTKNVVDISSSRLSFQPEPTALKAAMVSLLELQLWRELMLPTARPGRITLLEAQLWANFMSYSMDYDAARDGLDDGYDQWLLHEQDPCGNAEYPLPHFGDSSSSGSD